MIDQAELLVVNVVVDEEGNEGLAVEINPLLVFMGHERCAALLYAAADKVRAFADEAARAEEPDHD